jgi:hypothetical protein
MHRAGVILARMSGNFSSARTILVLALLAIVSRPSVYAQVPCPIGLLSAKAEKDTIQLEFVNKGKAPVEQLSLACVPSGTNKFPKGICRVETGIFYPNTVSWIKIDYLGANRHPIEISVTQLHLNGGILWQPSPTNRCKILRVTRKN